MNKYEKFKKRLSKDAKPSAVSPLDIDKLSIQGKGILKKSLNYSNIKSRYSLNLARPLKVDPLKIFTESQLIKSTIINNILSIRQEIREEIKSAGHRIPEIKNSLLTKWIKVINRLSKYNIKLFIESYRVLGELFMEFGEYEHAKRILLFLKSLCINIELPYDLSRIYETLGCCYKFLNNYKKAILCYKKQLQISWILKDRISELRAYDNIGIQYFYLNNKSKSKYYHQRYINGKVEQNTQLKQKFVSNIDPSYQKLFYKEENVIKQESDYIDNQSMINKLFEVISWYDIDKVSQSVDEFDTVKVSDKLNDSTISETDMTFLVISEENDDKDTKPCNKHLAFKLKYEYFFNISNDKEDEYPSINHLSIRRKEYNLERFEKIFERFDNLLDPARLHKKDKLEKLLKTINKGYIVN